MVSTTSTDSEVCLLKTVITLDDRVYMSNGASKKKRKNQEVHPPHFVTSTVVSVDAHLYGFWSERAGAARRSLTLVVSRDLSKPIGTLDVANATDLASAAPPGSIRPLVEISSPLGLPIEPNRELGLSSIRSRYHPYAWARRAEPDTPSRTFTRTAAHSLREDERLPYLLTPASSAHSPPPSTPLTLSDANSRSSTITLRNAKPTKTTTSAWNLIHHAIKILFEIWPRENIPITFRAPWHVNGTRSVGSHSSHSTLKSPTAKGPSPRQAIQCPPVTPESPPRSISAQSDPSLGEPVCRGGIVAEPGVLPLEKFVIYILRRSRTTCSVFSSALCYIEAIRTKVPLIAGLECTIQGSHIPVEEERRPQTRANSHAAPPTLPAFPLGSTPSSPLLCPRRTFVAALVVAWKCLQDQCFSNRVWAEICGLPPREITLCERALCEALEWRLWVGKGCSLPKTCV